MLSIRWCNGNTNKSLELSFCDTLFAVGLKHLRGLKELSKMHNIRKYIFL